jgi:cob(I)alamin adenosyltransferase
MSIFQNHFKVQSATPAAVLLKLCRSCARRCDRCHRAVNGRKYILIFKYCKP